MAFEELNTRVNGSQLQANMGNEVLLVGKGMQVRVLQTCQPQMGQLLWLLSFNCHWLNLTPWLNWVSFENNNGAIIAQSTQSRIIYIKLVIFGAIFSLWSLILDGTVFSLWFFFIILDGTIAWVSLWLTDWQLAGLGSWVTYRPVRFACVFFCGFVCGGCLFCVEDVQL